ncbi:hypothetical protein BGZ60DRAFT_419900 [Tricladium varicosporioides]|nr:hypothetical protein BGZ60DRAFT_419900 [Hymenoscyphus varicosporioides]
MKSLGLAIFCFVNMLGLGESREASKRFHLGVNLGPNFVTAAYFTEDDETTPKFLGPIFGGPDYKYWMSMPDLSGRRTVQGFSEIAIADTDGALVPIPPRRYAQWGYDYDQSERIITEVLSRVKQAARAIPGAPTTIGAISYPYFFDYDSSDAMLTAALRSEPQLKVSWQFRKVLNVARLAYGDHYCHTFGITRLPRLDPVHTHLMIFVDFDGKVLEITFIDVTVPESYPLEQFRMEDLGLYVAEDGDESHDSLDVSRNFNPEAYQQIMDAFRKLNESWLDKQPGELNDAYSFLRGILFIGDGQKAFFQQIREIIQNVFPTSEHNKILDLVEPSFVGAAGAAWLARFYEKHPKLLDTITSGPNWIGRQEIYKNFRHDEL